MSTQSTLGILAGTGYLPREIIEYCYKQGRQVKVIAFHGITPASTVEETDHNWLHLNELSKIIAIYKNAGVKQLVMAGGIMKRPSIAGLLADPKSSLLLARVMARAGRGDNTILSEIISIFEHEGFSVLGADEVKPSLLISEGALGKHQPTPEMLDDITLGIKTAHAIGMLDIGQAVIAQKGNVIGTEERDGTDALIKRCTSSLSEHQNSGVLVKMKKPSQDRRADLPSIGVDTVKKIHAAGLKGIAIEAGASLVINKEEVIKTADELGIFITGVKNPYREADTKKIFLIAGEASGDNLGGKLMNAIQSLSSTPVLFSGVGGVKMKAQGLQSIFPMEELSLMGVAEVLPHIPKLLKRIKYTTHSIIKSKPDVVVTIDSPGFNNRVAKQLKKHQCTIPLIHYVAPSVWAYHPKRAKHLARLYNHLLALLPFEPPYFEKEGLNTTYVGHPVTEDDAGKGDGDAFRKLHHIGDDTPLLLLLPGSRTGEIKRLLPIFRETLSLVSREIPALHVVISSTPRFKEHLEKETEEWNIPRILVTDTKEKNNAYAACNIALAKSGTGAFELALSQLPMVVAYKMHIFSALILGCIIRTPYVNLVNIILQREAIPEYLQHRCRPNLLANALLSLFKDKDAQQKQRDAMQEAIKQIHADDDSSPSLKAAKTVLSLCRQPERK